MSYEYKESIISDLVDMLELPSGVWKYTQKLNELHEVYAKAQAYDDIMKLLNKHTTFIEDYDTNWECFGEEMIDLGLNDL